MLKQFLILLVTTLLTTTAYAQSYPNLPTNLTPLFIYNGNVLPTNGVTGTTGMDLGYGNSFFTNNSIVSDSTAPVNCCLVNRFTYPTGMSGGTTGGQLNLWGSTGPRIPVMQYYEATYFKIVGSSFEGPGTGQWKALGYWAVGIPSGGYSGTIYNVFSVAGTSGTTSAGVLGTSWTFGIAAQGHVSWRIDAGTILADKWYRMEIYMDAGSLDTANGVLKVWLTNISDSGAATLVINSTNRPYRTTANPDGFWNRHYTPVWGGSSFGPKTRNDFVHIAHMAAYGLVSGGGATDVTNPNPPTGLTAQ